eukprot:UN24827
MTLIVYQKVGETEVPVGKIQIPTRPVFSHTGLKIPFDMNVKEVVKRTGKITGWVMSDNSSTLCGTPGNDSLASRSRSFNGSTTMTKTSTAMSVCSIDMVNEIPTKFYSLIPVRDVYRSVIRKFCKDLRDNNSALRF